jgi:hypothetical protein
LKAFEDVHKDSAVFPVLGHCIEPHYTWSRHWLLRKGQRRLFFFTLLDPQWSCDELFLDVPNQLIDARTTS